MDCCSLFYRFVMFIMVQHFFCISLVVLLQSVEIDKDVKEILFGSESFVHALFF